MPHSAATLHKPIHESPPAGLPAPTRSESGGALLPTVFTVIVLHLGAFGRRPAQKHVRAKTTIERVIARPRRDLTPPCHP